MVKKNPKAIDNKDYEKHVESWLKKNKPSTRYDTTPIKDVYLGHKIHIGERQD